MELRHPVADPPEEALTLRHANDPDGGTPQMMT